MFHCHLDNVDILLNCCFSVYNFLIHLLLILKFFIGNIFFPFLSFTVDPVAFLDFQLVWTVIIDYDVETVSVLLSILPFTVVSSAVGPQIHTLTIFTIIKILTNKHPAITPFVGSFTMHHVVFPFSEEQPVIVPNEKSFAIKHIILPFTDITVAIRPAVLTLALF